MAKQKYYVVWKGRSSGVFNTWEACSAQVTGFTGAEYKSFASLAEAKAAFRGTYGQFVGIPARVEPWKLEMAGLTLPASGVYKARDGVPGPILPSISVDAACSGVPGPVEWQGVETDSGKRLFRTGPYVQGTNNIGEFLAIVQGLRWLADRHLKLPLYSDSKNAILWIKLKKCRTKLERTSQNASLFALVAQAEDWLAENRIANKILKWDTEMWGENPADFGRK
jgi:ribonuclease HI